MAGAAEPIGAGLVLTEAADGRPILMAEVRGPDGELLEACVIDPLEPELVHVDAAIADDPGVELELTLDPDLEG